MKVKSAQLMAEKLSSMFGTSSYFNAEAFNR